MNPIAVALIQIAVSLIITAIASRMMGTQGIKAGKLDDFTFPTVSRDRSIPVVFGDVLVEGPNVTWFGDYRARGDEEGGNLFTAKTVVGYKYHIGMEIAISWGQLDSINQIWFGQNIAWDNSSNLLSGTVNGIPAPAGLDELGVDAMDLFGGDKNGGGVRAYCKFYPGDSEQGSDPYMESQVGDAYNHRGVAKLVWYGPSGEIDPEQATGVTVKKGKGGYVGESTFIPAIKLRVQHYPNFLGSSYKSINNTNGTSKGANPAEVVYCLLIGRYANVNSTQPSVPVIPENLIDKASFLAAATTLATEKMGISFQWQRDASARTIINDIMFHVEGYLSEDSSTGLIRMVLNRQDYDPNTVPVFDESNIVDFTSYVRINPTAAINRIAASYTEPDEEFKTVPVMVEDLGNVNEQDMGAPADIDLHMFHDVDVTLIRATRELIQLSEGIVSGAFKCNRDAYSLNIGDPIKLSWDGFGVDGLLVRVTEKITGDLEDRSITVKFVQDLYGIGTAVYGVPGGTSWQDIYNDPEDITDYQFFEEPYHWLANYPADTNYQLFLLTQQPTGDTIGYEPFIQVNDGGYVNGYGTDIQENEISYLASDYSQTYGPGKDTVYELRVVGEPPDGMDTTKTFNDIQNFLSNWVLVNGELMAYESVSDMGDGSWRLNNTYRGLADTIPANHLAGDRVWYVDSHFTRLARSFADLDDIDIKTIVTSGNGVLLDVNASPKTYVMTGRYDKPIAPANVTINGGYYPTVIAGPLELAWARRNRLNSSVLSKWDDPDETPEVNQTTTLKIYNQFEVLIRTETGLATTSYSYTFEQEIIDAGFLQDHLTVELFSERDGEISPSWSYRFQRIFGDAPSGMTLDLVDSTDESSANIPLDLDEIA